MTDEKKPPTFGEHSKEFLESFDKATKELQEQRAELREKRKLVAEKKELAEKRLLNREADQKALLESLKEVEEIDKGTMDNPVSESPEDARMSKYVNTLRNVDQQQRKRELDEGVELKETDLLGGADQAVTQAQLRRATGEMFARIQTSLASLGGGGLGKIEQGVQGNPQDGQLPMYDAATGDMVWASVFGVGEAYGDSDAIVVIDDVVDSAYINARVDAGLDSAAVINLITGTVDSDYVAARDSDLLSTAYTTADHDSDTLVQVDSAYINARVNAAGIATTDSLAEGLTNLYYTTARQDSDTTVLVDSAYVQARVDGGVDSAAIINLIIGTVDSDYVAARDSDGGFYTTADHDSDTLAQVDSAYVQKRQLVYGDLDVRGLLAGDSGVFNIMPAADSTYDLGDSNTRWRDLWLSGNTIHLGSQALQSRPDGVYANSKKLGFADSAYTTAQHDSDTLVQVDSAYVQIRVKSTDFVPEGVSNLYYETTRHDSDTLVQVDSAYVSARQLRTLADLDDTQIDSATVASDDFLRWNGTEWYAAPFNIEPAMDFHGSIDLTVDSAPQVTGGALYVNTGAGVVLGSYAGIAGDSIDSGQAVAFADYDSAWHILGAVNEAGVVEVRQGNGISVDDSNPARPFVAINRTEVDTWYVDSGRVVAMIDSAYVNLRADHYMTADHDSDTLAQVDSAYVQLRVGDIVDSAKIVNIIDSYVDSDFINRHVDFQDSAAIVAIIDSYVDSAFVIRHADSHFVNAAGDSMTGDLHLPNVNVEDTVFITDGELTADSAQEPNEDWVLTFTPVPNGTVDKPYGVSVSPNGQYVYAYGSGGDQILSTDGGETFSTVTSSTGNESNYAALIQDDGRIFRGKSNTVYRSVDFGASFTKVTPDKNGHNNVIIKSASWDDDIIFVVGNSTYVVTSIDGGDTWSLKYIPHSSSTPAMVVDDGSKLYILSENGKVSSWDGTSIAQHGGWDRDITLTGGSGFIPSTLKGLLYADGVWWALDKLRMWKGGANLTDPFVSTGGDNGRTSSNFGSHFAKIGDAFVFDQQVEWSTVDEGQTFIMASSISDTNASSNEGFAYNSKYVFRSRETSSSSSSLLRSPIPNTSFSSQALYWNGDKLATQSQIQAGVDGLIDMIANKDSLQGLELLNLMTFLDSDPTMPQPGFDSSDSAQAVLTSPRSGQFWYNTATNILAIRDQGVDSGDSTPRGWKSVVNPESVKAIIDSGYVQHRFQPGTLIAGGRVVATGATQTWTDSDGWPSRYVKSLWGIKDVDYLTGGVYQFFFDSAVNIALVDSYSYVVQSTLDYRNDDPGGISGSQRTLNVLKQDSNSFTLVLERGDGDNQDYGSQDDDTGAAIDGSIMNFTVTKAI